MKRTLKQLVGEPVAAEDGPVGRIEGVYFHDATWEIRHLVLEAGGGLSGRKVLIAPAQVKRGKPQAPLGVALTRHELMRAPGVESDMPVSAQFEEASAAFHGHSGNAEPASAADLRSAESKASRSHLRSTAEVIGYAVHGREGRIGHLADMAIDDETWRVSALILDSGKSVAPEAVRHIDWKMREIRLERRG